METKKISFGFSKINKKPNLLAGKNVKSASPQVELIKCFEGKEIQLVEEKKKAARLVIPLLQNTKTSAALASQLKRRAVLLGEEEVAPEESQESNILANGIESVEVQAARELLAEAQSNGVVDTNENKLVLAPLKPDELPLEGAKEPTQHDYEDIPVEHFGLAMLRGMGFVDPPKTKSSNMVDDGPFVRPRGMGLGADKALKPRPLLIPPEANEKLEIKRLSYVRILGGKHKDAYGQIEGFDDDRSRVIVKMAIGGTKESFNEFLCQPVAKKEYLEYGKCINTVKYEEYKRLENKYGVRETAKTEESSRSVKREHIDERSFKIKDEFKQEKYKEEHVERRSRADEQVNRSRNSRQLSTDSSASSDDSSDSAYERNSQPKWQKSKKTKKSSRSGKHRSKSNERRPNDDLQVKKSKSHNKKKTKKSKKQRSRSRSRVRTH